MCYEIRESRTLYCTEYRMKIQFTKIFFKCTRIKKFELIYQFILDDSEILVKTIRNLFKL